MKPFEDHFSSLAATYAQYRPRYPESLYAFLADVTGHGKDLAVDCATGSGQAALGLTGHFECVVAADASLNQVRQAAAHPRVRYLVSRAEHIPLESGSADLVAAAMAVHWFDLDAYYDEVRRVLRPGGGLFAAWGYHHSLITPAIDAIVLNFYTNIVGPYWSPAMRYLEEKYRTLPFPFEELPAPAFEILLERSLDEQLGFMDSWSAVKKFKEVKGYHPFTEMYADLVQEWGDSNSRRTIRLPMFLRVGKV
jgi:ubiquinone/menaquinone biosynthesis C-methylase UbiE